MATVKKTTVKKAQFGSLVKGLAKSAVKSTEKKAVTTIAQQEAKRDLQKAIAKRTSPKAKPSYLDEFDMPVSKSANNQARRESGLKKGNAKSETYVPFKSGGKVMKDGGKTPAWTRKEGKNPSGGLNAKGRASYNRANPGSNLKAPQPEGGPRKKSFCARMSGVKGPMKKPNGEPTRKALALRKWKC